MRSPLVPLVVLIVLAIPASAQVPPTLVAVRTTAPITLDGRLDEPDWSRAVPATDFTQRVPDPGRRATFRTEVRVLYDGDAVYVGARMFDPHPDSITAPLARKDPGNISSDWFDVIFDSYHDRRTAYRFGVNPAGTRLDVYHFNDTDDDVLWDALWDVATRIDSLGWVAEYRIPLSQLRFHRDSGEQTWGVQFYRAVARRDEWSHWVPYLPTTPGFVSDFGELRGLVGLTPPSPVEVVPYLLARSTRSSDGGADMRVGIGSGLSLTGTVNPDFGQVEVDPAVLNLSADETFLPEKRPFFLEGSGIFEFGVPSVSGTYGFSRFVHWRRIGATPIIAAAKLSGQPGAGWSLGVVDAATREPGSADNFFVGRAKRDLQDGRTSFGVLSTAAVKPLSRGYLVGVDGSHATGNRRWTIAGHIAASQVNAGAQAIAALQTSSARYFQRPDAAYLSLDSTRTSLRGYDAEASLLYTGLLWFGSTQLHETSPGYDANEIGYLPRADLRSLTMTAGRTFNGMQKPVRDLAITVLEQSAWNSGGDPIYQRVSMNTSATFRSLWEVTGQAAFLPSVASDRLTRGGPLTEVPAHWEFLGSVATDSRRRVVGGVNVTLQPPARGGDMSTASVSLVLRPRSDLQISVSPTLERVRNPAQYVRTVVDPLAAETFGHRYVFATLSQETVVTDVRADWTLAPTISLQLFAEPFLATPRFTDYKELRAPRTFGFDVYGRDAGTITPLADGTARVDPDGSGPAPAFVIGDQENERSFTSHQLRVNGVLRWEYRPGSILYAVWQQSRDAESARHVLILKASYRWGR